MLWLGGTIPEQKECDYSRDNVRVLREVAIRVKG